MTSAINLVRNFMIELHNVHKIYRLGEVDFPVLRGVSLKINKGEFISIMGPSGSGKSTLLNMIGALDRPTKGRVTVKGKEISRMGDDELAQLRGRTVGFVFQAFNLIPRLTALENVMITMWFAGIEGQEKRATTLLKKVGLGHRLNNKPSQLSGGELQRVALARSLANDPDVIVADEPTGNLDSKTGSEIMTLLKDIHKKEGKTLIIVTHDSKIANTADRKVHMLDGKIKKVIK